MALAIGLLPLGLATAAALTKAGAARTRVITTIMLLALLPLAARGALEVGFGSGLNLPDYDRERVDYVWALEPFAQMRALAAPRISASGVDVRILAASAEALPLPDTER